MSFETIWNNVQTLKAKVSKCYNIQKHITPFYKYILDSYIVNSATFVELAIQLV